MTLFKFNYKRLFAGVVSLAIISCANPWDDRENNGDANLNSNLTEAISNTAETSEFAELLVATGYDKVLAASKTYTVFVPTNAAMAAVSDAILDDPEALKEFVGNHIALTAYSSERSTAETKIKMYSNKYLTFKGATMIGDATIVTPDHYAKNGVFHIINAPLTPKLNIWQYIKSQEGVSATADYLLSLKDFSIYESDIDAKALSEERGAGYQSDSLTNSFLRNVYNLNNEKNSYTLFLMEDDGYNEEVDKMKPYLIKPSNDPERDSTAIYAQYFTLRDMAFAKKYELDELPEKLTSRFGVEFPVDKTQIVGEPIHLSNGIIYIMRKVNVELDKRLLPVKIEGEKYISYFNGSRNAIYYRERREPSDPNLTYSDVTVQNPGVPNFMLDYNAKELYSTTYRVYWRAINEQTNVFTQSLRIVGKFTIAADGSRTVSDPIRTFSNISVPVRSYDEVYLGDITLDKARNIDLISLIGANNSTNGNNSLTLDYLKFVPVLK